MRTAATSTRFEKWSKDGQRIEELLFAGNSLVHHEISSPASWQQEVFQYIRALTVRKRLTTEATRCRPLGGRKIGNFDDVIKRLALRTVEERPIAHSQLVNRLFGDLEAGADRAASM